MYGELEVTHCLSSAESVRMLQLSLAMARSDRIELSNSEPLLFLP